jgi:serine/threonine protein kinase
MNADDSDGRRFHVGSTIAGRYRVERPIGEGAMGAVALARHVSLDEKVAIKFLRPELRRDPVANARLSREAKALARIKSDHVARVLDVGATLSVGPYMVMEYLEGTDLGDVLETEGPLPVARAVECVLQVCEALTVAHTAGITHRDIKPQNLFLARHGRFETLKILDFGIAEDATPARDATEPEPAPASGSSQTSRALAPVYGTPPYMAPERVRNDPDADHRSDIWSVGVVLHELVTGRAVFDAPTITETCARIVSNEPLELERNGAVLPPSLRNIIARCLERDPARRYQCVEELAAALAPLATMHERFRGRSTGAFSRRLIEEELARQAKNPPTSAPPTWQAVLQLLSDSVSWLRQHAILTYLVMAVASALVVGIGVRLIGGVRWMEPPPKVAVPIRAEPPALSRSEPPALSRSEPPRERSLGALRTTVESLLPLAAASVSDGDVGPVGSEPVRSATDTARTPDHAQADVVPKRRPSSPRASASRASRDPATDGAARPRGAPQDADRVGRSRVRLVQERQDSTDDADAQEKQRPKKSRPLPAWLQPYQSTSE